MIDHELYVPTVAQLNDPADGRPRLAEMTTDQMIDFLYKANTNPTLTADAHEIHLNRITRGVTAHGAGKLQRKLAQMLNKHFENYRVYSLTKRYNNLSLWAAYAANHSGYCMEFSNTGPLFENAVEVIYREIIPMDVTNPEHRKGYFLYCKRPEWLTEEEVRLISLPHEPSTVKIDPSWLTRIILGKDISDANASLIHQWAQRRTPPLTVVKAYYDELSQELRLISNIEI